MNERILLSLWCNYYDSLRTALDATDFATILRSHRSAAAALQEIENIYRQHPTLKPKTNDQESTSITTS